jgi:hypothetical protein
LAYEDFDSSFKEFKKLKEISKNKQLLREEIESVRGMATAKYRAGNFDEAFSLIDSALREIDVYSGEKDEVGVLRLELITDLYIFGEYFRGWKWVDNEINSKFTDNKIPKKFEEIWIKWCIQVEETDTLLAWVSARTGEISGSDESTILLRAQVLSHLKNFESARLELNSLERILENNKKSIDYLITKFELDLFSDDDSGLKGPDIDPEWAKINRRDEFYKSYYAGLFYAHQGDFLKASNLLDTAHRGASEVLGKAHPTVANLAFSALVARSASGAYFPRSSEIEPLLSVMARSYGLGSRRYIGAAKWLELAPDGRREEFSSSQIWRLHDPRL